VAAGAGRTGTDVGAGLGPCRGDLDPHPGHGGRTVTLPGAPDRGRRRPGRAGRSARRPAGSRLASTEDPDSGEDTELSGRDTIADRLSDEVSWLRQCAGWLAHLDTDSRAGPGVPSLLHPPAAARFLNPATGAGLGRLEGRAIPARRDQPTTRLHRQPVPATLTTTRATARTKAVQELDALAVLTGPLLPAPRRRARSAVTVRWSHVRRRAWPRLTRARRAADQDLLPGARYPFRAGR
jgi:hypothetical protein